MLELEREKTYLAKKLPQDLKAFPSEIIRDAYVTVDSGHVLRLRKKGERYEITRKEQAKPDDASCHNEHTIPLTEAEFDALCPDDVKCSFKRRYSYSIDGRTADVDVYLEDLKGLVLIDIEFDSDESMKNFQPPTLCLADVTEELLIAGGTLAGSSYEHIGPELEKNTAIKH